jgi:hypothetical protein
LEQKTATEDGCPFKCQHVSKLPAYSPDMCMKTKDIMLRLATIAISPSCDSAWVSATAEKITGELKKMF